MTEALSIAEFERLLSRGRGKAILHLKQHDAAPYLEALYNCCLTNTSYARPCKDSRAVYLLEAITLANESDQMSAILIEALNLQSQFTPHFAQYFDLLGHFARRGHHIARHAMYAWCRLHYDPRPSPRELAPENRAQPSMLAPLLELDGLYAFLFLIDLHKHRYGEMASGDYCDFVRFLALLEQQDSHLIVHELLRQAAQYSPELWETIEKIYERHRDQQKQNAQLEQDWINLSYPQLHHRIELERYVGPLLYREWGEKASDADLYRAAIDFTTSDVSKRRLFHYLLIFTSRTFPLEDLTRLFDLAYLDPVEKVVNPIALGVFENISSSRVRDFALDLITSGDMVGRAVSLLMNNFREGDWTLIESLFDGRLDGLLHDYEYHDLGFSIQKIFKKYPSLDAIPSLIRMYDVNPCSRCRMNVVESLVSLNALPDWIAEECFYDANLDLRAYAQRGFKDAPDADD